MITTINSSVEIAVRHIAETAKYHVTFTHVPTGKSQQFVWRNDVVIGLSYILQLITQTIEQHTPNPIMSSDLDAFMDMVHQFENGPETVIEKINECVIAQRNHHLYVYHVHFPAVKTYCANKQQAIDYIKHMTHKQYL
jgi:hypothetical protein